MRRTGMAFLVGESRVLVAVHWSPSFRAECHAFTGTKVWGSSEQRVVKLHLSEGEGGGTGSCQV